jgi:hypothetical protein
MKSFIIASFSLAIGIAAVGCKDEPKPNPTPPGAPAAATPSTAPKEGGAHAGPKHDLGSGQAGGYTVKATQIGTPKPAAESIFEITVTGGTGKPSAVRAWAGSESGEGALKAKAVLDGDDYDVHVEIPASLTAETKLWVELETAAGKVTTSFALKQ